MKKPVLKYSPFSMLRAPFFLVGFCILLSVNILPAAELQLRTEPISCHGTLVALDEIAKIVPDSGEMTEEIDRLRETILFAAPSEGEQRTVRTMELRNILSRLGVNSTRHRLVGATKIVLIGGRSENIRQTNQLISHENPIQQVSAFLPQQTSASYESKTASPNITPQFIQTLESQLSEALATYLNHTVLNHDVLDRQAIGLNSTIKRSWKIKVELNERQARQLATGGQIEEIFGGLAPYTGLQKFDIQMQRNLVVPVEAEITPLHRIVSVRRTLPRGHVINESDVMITEVEKIAGDDFYIDLADVIGLETVGTIRERDVLSPKMLKRPNWVRKGDVVTVRSICDGITVRVSGVAQSDGCQGDTIVIESIEPTAKNRRSKKNTQQRTFLARVCEPQTVEVNASPTAVHN